MSKLTRRTPFSSPSILDESDGMNALFRRMFNDSASPALLWTPSVEVQETNDDVILTAELPGMTEKDLTITIENNLLTIAGEKRAEHETRSEDERTLISERYFGTFSRTFTLPRSVDADSVKADFANGVLTVTMPKSAAAKGRVIQVKSAKK